MKKYNFITIGIQGNNAYSDDQKKSFLQRLIHAIDSVNTAAIITSSNCTGGFVPLIFIHKKMRSEKIRIKNGSLVDIAPSILSLLKLIKPDSMTGRDLLDEIHV